MQIAAQVAKTIELFLFVSWAVLACSLLHRGCARLTGLNGSQPCEM
jgi:hypothetical protein